MAKRRGKRHTSKSDKTDVARAATARDEVEPAEATTAPHSLATEEQPAGKLSRKKEKPKSGDTARSEAPSKDETPANTVMPSKIAAAKNEIADPSDTAMAAIETTVKVELKDSVDAEVSHKSGVGDSNPDDEDGWHHVDISSTKISLKDTSRVGAKPTKIGEKLGAVRKPDNSEGERPSPTEKTELLAGETKTEKVATGNPASSPKPELLAFEPQDSYTAGMIDYFSASASALYLPDPSSNRGETEEQSGSTPKKSTTPKQQPAGTDGSSKRRKSKTEPEPNQTEFQALVARAMVDGTLPELEREVSRFLDTRGLLADKEGYCGFFPKATEVNDVVAESSTEGTTLEERGAIIRQRDSALSSGDLGPNWDSELNAELTTGPAVDPKTLAANPLSERGARFIESMRESIINAGFTQSIVKTGIRELTEKHDDRQMSGEWRPAQGDDDVQARPVLPPAAMRKKKQPVEVQKVTLEERLVQENISARAFEDEEEEQQLSIRRLKDRTTTGQYTLFLGIYVACMLLAFCMQKFVSPDLLQAANSAGKSAEVAVERVMLPQTFQTFIVGLHYYEDETLRNATKKGPPTMLQLVIAGIPAFHIWSEGPPTAAPLKNRRNWFQLPTGFILGWPAAALYTVHSVYVDSVTQKSALELLLNMLMYATILALSAMIYIITQQRWPLLPPFATPVVVVVGASVTSIGVWAVMSFSESIGKSFIPDTVLLFTALAVAGIAAVAVKVSFLKPKKKRRSMQH